MAQYMSMSDVMNQVLYLLDFCMKSEKRTEKRPAYIYSVCAMQNRFITDINSEHPVPKTEFRFYAGGKHLKAIVAASGLSALPSIQTCLNRGEPVSYPALILKNKIQLFTTFCNVHYIKYFNLQHLRIFMESLNGLVKSTTYCRKQYFLLFSEYCSLIPCTADSLLSGKRIHFSAVLLTMLNIQLNPINQYAANIYSKPIFMEIIFFVGERTNAVFCRSFTIKDILF